MTCAYFPFQQGRAEGWILAGAVAPTLSGPGGTPILCAPVNKPWPLTFYWRTRGAKIFLASDVNSTASQ